MLLKLFISSRVMKQQPDTDLLWQVWKRPLLSDPSLHRIDSIPHDSVGFVAMATRRWRVIKNFLQAFSISISAPDPAPEWSVCGIWFRCWLSLTASRVDSHLPQSISFLLSGGMTPRHRLEIDDCLWLSILFIAQHFPISLFPPPFFTSTLQIFATSSINWRLCCALLFVFYYVKVLFRLPFQVSIVSVSTSMLEYVSGTLLISDFIGRRLL